MSTSWRVAIFLASFFPLLGLKRGFSIIGILLALHGWFLLFSRARELWRLPAFKCQLMLAGGFALPLVLALPDANFPAHALQETVMAVAYLPMLISVFWLVSRHEVVQPFMRISLGIAVFWSLDACLQQLWGRDLFGMTLGDRAGGYWQTQAKFGYYMGYFGLFAWLCDLHLNPGRLGRALAVWSVLTAGVLVGVNREAWLVYFPASALIFWFGPLRAHPWRWPLALGMVALAILGFLAGWAWSPHFRVRIDQTLLVLDGTYEALDAALSHRLGIWLPAWDLSLAHWFNGMGQDGFLLTFLSVTPDPVHLEWGIRMHPHQVLLEIATTAGLLGFAGIGVALLALRRAWRLADVATRAQAFPFMIYLVALWFPFNTHRSFYSSELMMGNWMMLGFLVAILFRTRLKQDVIAS